MLQLPQGEARNNIVGMPCSLCLMDLALNACKQQALPLSMPASNRHFRFRRMISVRTQLDTSTVALGTEQLT